MSETVQVEIIDDVALVRLGSSEESVVVLTESRMASLEKAIEALEKEKDLKGLVIAGANTSLFCAGADINQIGSVADESHGADLARRGQDLFESIENLPFTTVAAISGACVGGGFEMVLACDYRLAADNSHTKLGLPETKLGILPGFGGTQRLPRLIGVRPALDIILKGRVSPVGIAKKLGMVDKLVPDAEKLVGEAIRVASGKLALPKRGPSKTEELLGKTSLGRLLIKKMVGKSLAKTAKHYPAPSLALEAVLKGFEVTPKEAYEFEAKSLGKLIVTPECKALVHLFFLTQDAGRIGASAKSEVDGTSISVLGAGTMGAGIAASFLLSGHPVCLADTVKEAREKAGKKIASLIEKKKSFNESKKKKTKEALSLTDDLGKFSGSSLVVEAIIENLDIKREVFASLEEVVGDSCLLASNTSSLSIGEIAEGLKKPERFIGLHFFNPAEKMQLVEIVLGQKTEDSAVAFAAALVSAIGKYPVVVKDVAGFLVNRSLTPYLVEAAFLISEGVSIQDIDKAARNFGMPMGPVELLDEIGLDIAAKVSQIMEESYGARMTGPKHAEDLVGHKLFGKKSGAGFYLHNGKKRVPNEEALSKLQLNPSTKPIKPEVVEQRLILALVNEAVRCLDEGVCGTPGKEAASQIDLASVFGIGFAPFRGGVIKYADTLGAEKLYKTLDEFSKVYGERFNPTEGIKQRAEEGKGFY